MNQLAMNKALCSLRVGDRFRVWMRDVACYEASEDGLVMDGLHLFPHEVEAARNQTSFDLQVVRRTEGIWFFDGSRGISAEDTNIFHAIEKL